MKRTISISLVLAVALVLVVAVAAFAQESTPDDVVTWPAGYAHGYAATGAQGPNFIDEDGDGICDNWVDDDGDGVCDLAPRDGTGMQVGQGRRGAAAPFAHNFVDADGDGVCDNWVDENNDGINDLAPRDGTGNQYRPMMRSRYR